MIAITERYPLALIGLISFIFCLPLFINGMPMISSYAHNTLLHEEISLQFQAGILYPRWLPGLYGGYGSPSGFYYPPLLFWFSSLLDLMTFKQLSSSSVLIFVIYLSLFASGISFYFLARTRINCTTSCMLAIIYMILPYHFSFEILMRNALAEFMTYIWLPLIFLCIHKNMFKDTRYMIGYTISYSLLILTHLPIALITSFFIGLYSLFISRREQNIAVIFIAKFISLSLVSVGLTAIYLYPALTMLDLINMKALRFYDVHDFFINLFTDPKQDSSLLVLFFMATIQFVISLYLFTLFFKGTDEKQKPSAIFICLSCILCFYLMTSYSSVIWNVVPLINNIQFPWRLLVISDFFLLLLAVYCFECRGTIHQKKHVFLILFTYCFCFNILYFAATYQKRPDLLDITSSIQKQQLLSRSPNSEHVPKSSFFNPDIHPQNLRFDTRDLALVKKGNGSIVIQQHLGRQAILEIMAETPLTIEFRQFMFHGWSIQDMKQHKDVTNAYNLRGSPPYGQMIFDIPAGENLISIELKSVTYETIGKLVSLLSLILLLFWIFTTRRSNIRTKRAAETGDPIK